MVCIADVPAGHLLEPLCPPRCCGRGRESVSSVLGHKIKNGTTIVIATKTASINQKNHPLSKKNDGIPPAWALQCFGSLLAMAFVLWPVSAKSAGAGSQTDNEDDEDVFFPQDGRMLLMVQMTLIIIAAIELSVEIMTSPWCNFRQRTGTIPS